MSFNIPDYELADRVIASSTRQLKALADPLRATVRHVRVPAELFEFRERAVALSQGIVDTALASGGFDQPGSRTWPDGHSPSIRWILVHLIEKYARRNGHADLLGEAADGATGE